MLGMIAGYAEVSPDIFVRTSLSHVRQGAGSVQAYYENSRAVLSHAGISPIIEAEALCGTSSKDSLERIRTAIAGCSDVD